MATARFVGLGAFVLLLPVTVEIPAARDSGRAGGETRATFAAGGGRYAIIDRGCEGQVLATHAHRFQDASGEVEHRFATGVTLGARAGVVWDQAESGYVVYDYSTYPYGESLAVVNETLSGTYFNPSLGYEGTYAGLALGWVMPQGHLVSEEWDNQSGGLPSFHLRVGRLDGAYLRISLLESVPFYSGGGMGE